MPDTMMSNVPLIGADAERQARVDLAASFRLAVRNGFNEGIDNHFTLNVPGKADHYYLNAWGLHWSEVTASNLIEVDRDGDVTDGSGIADRTAVCIHGPIHRMVPGAACVLHTHMPFATALTQLEDMELEMTGQNAIGFHGDIAYDYEYGGLALASDEGERMAKLMGEKPILMLANHGVIVTGRSVAQAFHRLYFLERACQTQVYSMWTGEKRRVVPKKVIKFTRSQFGDTGLPQGMTAHDTHFAALKRLLDRNEPDYAH